MQAMFCAFLQFLNAGPADLFLMRDIVYSSHFVSCSFFRDMQPGMNSVTVAVQ